MNKLIMPLLIILSVMLIIMVQMGFIFLLLALLPSITAFYIDTDKGRPIFKTVLTCNVTAMLPWLVPMMMAGMHFRRYDSYAIMANPRVWLIVFGGAAVGWALIYVCGFMARFFIAALYEYNAVSLEKFQTKLVGEWGNDIVPKGE